MTKNQVGYNRLKQFTYYLTWLGSLIMVFCIVPFWNGIVLAGGQGCMQYGPIFTCAIVLAVAIPLNVLYLYLFVFPIWIHWQTISDESGGNLAPMTNTKRASHNTIPINGNHNSGNIAKKRRGFKKTICSEAVWRCVSSLRCVYSKVVKSFSVACSRTLNIIYSRPQPILGLVCVQKRASSKR